jgi:hypothetical protein
MPRASLIIGSSEDADLQLQGSDIAATHAKLEYKGGRLYCTALGGDLDLLLSPTACWMDGVELRPGVGSICAVAAAMTPALAAQLTSLLTGMPPATIGL